MASASTLVTATGWLAIAVGAAMTLMGIFLFAQMFLARGIPVGAAGVFVILTMGAGPLLAAMGVTIIVSGFKLMGGHVWARTSLEIFSWLALCASAGWLIYSAIDLRHIHTVHVVRGALFFLVTGGPAILLITLLRIAR